MLLFQEEFLTEPGGEEASYSADEMKLSLNEFGCVLSIPKICGVINH